jgi:hypothetical protein
VLELYFLSLLPTFSSLFHLLYLFEPYQHLPYFWKKKKKKKREEKGRRPEIHTTEESSQKPTRKVVMDVGGTRFTTTRDTLLSVEDTYFSALLGGNFQVCREQEKERERKEKEERNKKENHGKGDVGGTRFTTTRDTLLSVEDTYFSALLGGNFQVCNCDREKGKRKEEGKEKEKRKGKKKKRGTRKKI